MTKSEQWDKREKRLDKKSKQVSQKPKLKTCGQCDYNSEEYSLENKTRCPFCGGKLIIEDRESLV